MKRRKGLFLVLILAVLLAGGLFLPRRLSRLCLESSVENLTSVEVYCPPNGGEGEFEEQHITQPEELEALKTLLHLGYARPKLFHVDYVNGGFAGYDFVFQFLWLCNMILFKFPFTTVWRAIHLHRS